MRIILLIVAFVTLSSASPSIKEQWTTFKRQHGKTYQSPSEEHFRIAVFMENVKMIEEHNAKYAAGLVSYKMKLNRFGDMLPEEVGAFLNGFNRTGLVKNHKLNSINFMLPANVELPASVDWRKLGAVTPVKNQGECGGCWAFSASGALEAQLFRKTGKLIPLSEQQLIDCSERYGNEGCAGGLMDNAFDYIKDIGGVASEESYPYIGSEENCRYKGLKAVEGTSLRAHVNIPQGSEEDLMAAVATVGPVSAAVSATNRPFMHYGGGIFTGESCDGDLDHAILVVGYGTEEGQDYWLVKNSWGPNWGEDGYVRLARNKGNVCGIADLGSYPLL